MKTMLKFRHIPMVAGLALSLGLHSIAAQQPAAAPARQLGQVKSIDGTTLTVVTKDATVTVPVAADATVLQLAPGSTDLKTAQPAKFSDIAVGDKVLTGKAGDTATATRIILMKSGDIAARNAAEQADWQRRGTGGIVKAVTGTDITVSAGAKTVTVDTTSKTVFKRYAADSIKFQDATTGTLDQIRPGDQLSVRGDKSPDGSTITAEEVVTGTFANLSGLLTSVDPAAGTVSLTDLTTKKPVTVKVTANADLRSLPAQAAAMFAARNNPGAAGGAAGGGPPGGGAPAGGAPGGGAPGGGGRNRAGMDLSRMLSRLPTQTVADLKKGDAVMIVASPSTNGYTAITLLSGVDALLTAPPGAAPITLAPWSLGVPDAGGGGGPQ
jgi:co-chaperonin GroES (HSP10)